MSQTITVSNLPDYIREVQKFKSRSFSFRGERGQHDARLSSAFRKPRIEKWPDEKGDFCVPMPNGYNDFMEVVDEFFTSVAHRLSETEKEHFIPFAQHHGIPTNLLDITSAPLVALFMACYKKRCVDCEKNGSTQTQNGHVYVFYNNYAIDITDIVDYSSWNICRSFMMGDRTVARKFCEKAQKLMQNLSIVNNDMMTNLMESVFTMASACLESNYGQGNEFENKLKEICKKHEDTPPTLDDMKTLRDKILKQPRMKRFAAIFDDEDSDFNGHIDNQGCIYTILLLYCCKKMIFHNVSELFPLMTYRPRITFDRAREQQGFFINWDYQTIEHAHIIEIENTEEILKELDSIGINYGTIYGDFDSIALHIKEKHEVENC